MVAAVCSRRAGKSFGLAYKILKAMLKHEGCLVAYITLTRENARNIIWPPLRDLAKAYRIRLKFNKNSGAVEAPNGSRMLVFGAATPDEMEKIRGSKYPVAVIDEAQGIGSHMVDMIDDCIMPALLDYGEESQLLVTGTPNAACAGPFYDLCHNSGDLKGFSVHRWTMLENPHLPNPAEWLRKMMERKRWDHDNATYRREYRGEWVKDTEGQVYRFGTDLCIVNQLPEDIDDYEYVLGVDLGYRDPTAFTVVAYSEESGLVYAVESCKTGEMMPSDVIVEVEKYCQQYPIDTIVADPGGGMSRALIEEMKVKHALPAQPAQKQKKADFIQMLNDDLLSAQMRIFQPGCEGLVEEMRMLQWDERSMRTGKLKEDKRTPNHQCDSLLYAWRECRHHNTDWEHEGPKEGSFEWWEQETDKWFLEDEEASWLERLL